MHSFLEKRYEYWASQWELFISKATTLKEKILQSFDFLVYISEKKTSEDVAF